MIVLWLLILRGIGIELRMHLDELCGAASLMVLCSLQHSACDLFTALLWET